MSLLSVWMVYAATLRIEGGWENTKVDRLIAQMVALGSYSVEWKHLESQLGDIYQVSTIRIWEILYRPFSAVH